MPTTIDILKQRAKIMQSIRDFFTSYDFLEVETPYLVTSPGMEPHLNAFETTFIPEGFKGNPNSETSSASSQIRHLYLPTSPEFHMKRLLCQGHHRIFQLARSFRNGETGDLHQPEFTMLEWYRANDTYESIMEDTEMLFYKVAINILGKPTVRRQDQIIDLSPPWERLTVKEAWLKYTGIDLNTSYNADALRTEGRELGVPHLLDDDPQDVLYFKIFLNLIEPKLGLKKPTILYEYPADMAALARLKPDDPSVALRFEVYAGGLELGNAFDELTDPDIQLQRCHEAQQIQLQEGNKPFPIDHDFINALKSGMPRSAGIAVGVDRMIMLLLEKESIKDVVAFSW